MEDDSVQNTPLWQPGNERAGQTNMAEFMKTVSKNWQVDIQTFDQLHRFSIEEVDRFWLSFKDYAGVIAESWGETVIENPHRMPGARASFPTPN